MSYLAHFVTVMLLFNRFQDIEHEQFIDGKIQSLAVNSNGDFFMTKQPSSDESIIYK